MASPIYLNKLSRHINPLAKYEQNVLYLPPSEIGGRDTMKAHSKKAHPKKAHPKKAHPKKAQPRKSQPKKAESRKTDPNKALYEKRPWLKFYLKEVPPDVKIPEKSAVDTFDEATDKWKDRTALVFYGRKIRYRELT